MVAGALAAAVRRSAMGTDDGEEDDDGRGDEGAGW